MQTYQKSRIEILVEAPFLDRLMDRLDRLPITGYTVLPALAGKGTSGSWRRDGLVGGAGQMHLVFCIVDGAKADEVVDAVFQVIERQMAIVTVSEVKVLRPERF